MAFSDFYKEYLNSEEWEAKRQDVFRYKGRRCLICGKAKKVQVHHLTYERFGHEDIDDLAPVCERCHKLIHVAGGKQKGYDAVLFAHRQAETTKLEKLERKAKRREYKRRAGLKRWKAEQAAKAETKKFVPKHILRKAKHEEAA